MVAHMDQGSISRWLFRRTLPHHLLPVAELQVPYHLLVPAFARQRSVIYRYLSVLPPGVYVLYVMGGKVYHVTNFRFQYNEV